MRRSRAALVVALGMLAAAPAGAGWFSDELPPAGAKPLSEIVKAVEAQGLGRITEVEFEDGVWQIEVHKQDGGELDVRVDPMSGEITSPK
jgi:hypothetical protein